MFYFLGIVDEYDLLHGDIWPSYILCQAHGSSEKRSGWRVVKQNHDNPLRNMNKILTTSLIGNEAMIDFLCQYRTRDHMHGDKKYKKEDTKKYYPKGALCWFECDQYGMPSGTAILIKRVPIKQSGIKTDSGMQRLKEAMVYKPPLNMLFAREPTAEMHKHANIKPKLVQKG